MQPIVLFYWYLTKFVCIYILLLWVAAKIIGLLVVTSSALWDISRAIRWKPANVSVASIFRVEE
jgi:hypothetical protein